MDLKKEITIPDLRRALGGLGGLVGAKKNREAGRERHHELVGLKVGASQIAAAHVVNNGSARVMKLAREQLAPGIVAHGQLRDPAGLAAALGDFFRRYELPANAVRLGVATDRIGVRAVEVGDVTDESLLANAVRFRAQELLPIPLDQAVIDYRVLGRAEDEDGNPIWRVILVVAHRELVDPYSTACMQAGVKLVGIDLEAFGLLRALAGPQAAPSEEAAALVAVSVGHERSILAVSDGQVCDFARVIAWGGSSLTVALSSALAVSPAEAENVKRSLSFADRSVVPQGLTPEQTRTAVDEARRELHTFARELVSSLHFYQSQPGSLAIGEVVLTGGTTSIPGLAAELERLVSVPVRVADPLARVEVDPAVGAPDQVGSLTVAIGLGIED